ncbi:MAG: ABC transporter ATP-binding protein [Acidobacteriota bacterium]
MIGAFLRLVNVTKRFGRREVVRDLSLEVSEGEVVAMLGPSGCGKTTVLRIIAGLETPDEGEVWIAGRRVAADGINIEGPRTRRVGFVFQDLALWPHLTVAGNLDFALSAVGVARRERAERINEALRMARIESFASSYPDQLSGGEQQRAALARAIVSRPGLLLLDEPMSSLDAELKSDLIEEIAALQRSLQVTTIYITHDRAEAAAIAHRVAVLREGRIERIDRAASS